MNHSLKVSKNFSQARDTYDQHALIPKFTAQRLAAKILNEKGPSLGTVLEVGSGTGGLTELLASHAHDYIVTDIAFPLVEKTRKKIKNAGISPLVVDGERPCFTACFDIIVSNLVFHWFQDPKNALTRLVACLKPGGKLYASMLGNNTFHEWRAAHNLADAPCGILDFISFGQLKNWFPLSGTRQVEEEWVTVRPANAIEFLRSLKAMGAHLSHPGHKPLPHKTFKQVMNIYDQNPQTSCQILYGIYQKPEKMREE